MSDMSMNGGGQLTAPGAIEADVARVRNAQLDAAEVLARKAAGISSGAEAKDLAQASMALSQAVVILDPSLDQQGIPLSHQRDMEQVRQDGQEKLERARQAAAAPSPAKRKVKVHRDGGGHVTKYEEE
jgi:hypothetical protein